MNTKLQCAFNVVVKYGFCGDCHWKLDSEQCHKCDCYENGVKRIREALEITSEVAKSDRDIYVKERIDEAPTIDAVLAPNYRVPSKEEWMERYCTKKRLAGYEKRKECEDNA